MSEYSKAALYEIIEKPLEEDFGIAFVNTTYVAAVYEIQNMETGLTEWNQSGLVMGISFGTIIVGSMVTIFFCVGRVWMKVNKFVHSQIFDKVQKELFKAQCLQTMDHKMLIRVFTHFPVVINWIAFFLALLLNNFLAYCIRSSETKHFGNYEKMMYANMANLLFFSTLHTYLHPIISIERNVLYVFTRLDYFQLPKLSIRILMALYGMSYCMSLVLCAVTFIYRFDRVCHSTLQYFQTRKQMLLWLFLVFSLGLYWGFCIFHFAQATPYVDKIIEKPLEEDFGVAFVNTTYVAAVYEIQNVETGLTEWNQSGLVMGVSFGTIIVGSMVTIFFCVGRVWMKVNTFVHSQIFDKVQKELFKAQCLQALIPVAVIFIPILSFLALPMLNIHGYTGLSFVSVFIGLYPVIDPIALMYTITEYRELMFELFICR